MLAANFSSIGSGFATVAIDGLEVAALGSAAFSARNLAFAARSVASSRVASVNCSVNLAVSADPATLAVPVAPLLEMEAADDARFSRSARQELFGSSDVDNAVAATFSPPRSRLEAVVDGDDEAEDPVSVLDDTVEDPAADASEFSVDTLAQPAKPSDTVAGARKRSTRRFMGATE